MKEKVIKRNRGLSPEKDKNSCHLNCFFLYFDEINKKKKKKKYFKKSFQKKISEKIKIHKNMQKVAF